MISFLSPSVWVFILALLLIVEATTTNFVTIWFAVGALAAFITSLFTASPSVQIIVFAVVSGVTVLCTRPLVRKWRTHKKTPLNADRNIGRTAVVVEALNADARGRVRLDGVEWAAKASFPLAEGEKCRVVAIDSTLLTVEPLPANAVQ